MIDSSCLIDDLPVPVERVSSVEEIGELVRRAATDRTGIYPLGGRTMLGFGNRPTKPGIGVDLRALDQVIDYPARDMTITVQAGITVARLQAILAPENQRLPIDVPRADVATLGGILATNSSGPRRYGYGTLRDYVLGISAVNDEGQVIKAGGRVVKNVAGYDLCKLYTGSLGTLGVITQVTLKLRPRAEEQAIVTLSCPPEKLGGVLEQLQRSRTRPVCIDVLNPAAVEWLKIHGLCVQRGGWLVIVGYEGNAEAVQWQVQELMREMAKAEALQAHVGESGLPWWNGLTQFLSLTKEERDTLTFRANLLPSATAAFCREVDALPAGAQLQAHAGNGIVIGHLGPINQEQAVAMLGEVREHAGRHSGRVVILRCPSAWKDNVNVWGPSGGDAGLMRAVKDKLDPRRIFNPGRFVDGL